MSVANRTAYCLRTNDSYIARRFMYFILLCSARTVTPGRSRRNTSCTNRTCWNMQHVFISCHRNQQSNTVTHSLYTVIIQSLCSHQRDNSWAKKWLSVATTESCSRLQLSSTAPCPATARAEYCQLVADARSADNRALVVSRTCSSFGDKTFTATGPQVWNSLPPNFRLYGLSYSQFRQLLKSYYSYSEAMVQCELFFNCAA